MSHSSHSQLSFAFEVLGNISSFVCFLVPLPTFLKVCKQKSMEGLQLDSTSYVAALLNSMIWIGYAYVKTGETLIIIINAFSCLIQTIYLAIFLTFCNKESRISTLKMIAFWNIRVFGSIVILIHVLAKREETSVKLFEAIAVCVFAALLSITQVVLYTESVKYIPVRLFILLLASANVMWLLYGISVEDIYFTVPSVLELIFGFIQIVLYAMYKNNNHHGDNINNNTIINENIEAITVAV